MAAKDKERYKKEMEEYQANPSKSSSIAEPPKKKKKTDESKKSAPPTKFSAISAEFVDSDDDE